MPDGGRSSSFKPEFTEQAAFLCKFGAIDTDMAEFFEVSGHNQRVEEI
jgi:hypothetical protein